MAEEDELRKRLKEHGYTLYKITPFQHHDRIHLGNSKIRIVLNLKGKLSEIALEALIEACIGSDLMNM